MSGCVIINGSPRAGGNSDAITELAVRELTSAGVAPEAFYVRDHAIAPCIGCDRCKKTDVCVFQDSAAEIIGKLLKADAALLIAPIYYTSVPGTVKVLIDRFYVNYNFERGLKAPNPARKFGVVFTYGGTPDAEVMKAVDLVNYAFRDLGCGAQRSVLCGMNVEKTSFSANGAYRRRVCDLTAWLSQGG
ncbi:MAG: flavodoxin family protein [Oscillospiraceae bacterium]|jgi:multimeric flavodoxin WrbA|nr:flavodoxin family protein [Oscillospiraceae bacterium]